MAVRADARANSPSRDNPDIASPPIRIELRVLFCPGEPATPAVHETGKIRAAVRALGLTRRTGRDRVRALIQALRPQDCGLPLVRIGGPGDGGYLVPDDLAGIEYCFSPGVSTVSTFENQLADRGIRSFLADASVNAPPIARPEFVFDKKFLGPADAGQYMTLASWKNRYLPGYAGDLLLQMDIEGAEYEVLLTTPAALLDRFRIILVEFHFLDRMFEPEEFPIIEATFHRLLRFFHVAHIHPNNIGGSVVLDGIEVPRLLEFTFLNKRRVARTRPQTVFPHPLDADNGRRRPLALPDCWRAA